MNNNQVKFKIVTSATPEFIPGIIALRNSIEINFPEAELWCYFYSKGKKDIKLPDRINYIHEAPMEGDITDKGKYFRHGLPLGPDMYARVLIPRHFTGRVFYVDADCLILKNFKDLWDLDLADYPTACVYRPDIGWHGGNKHDDMGSGTFLCDTEKWREMQMVEKIYEVMKLESAEKIRKFDLNVESAMSFAHEGNFLHLPAEYQNLTYYKSLTSFDIIAHYAGPKPWLIEEHLMSDMGVYYNDLWTAYYLGDIEDIKDQTALLPNIKKADIFSTEMLKAETTIKISDYIFLKTMAAQFSHYLKSNVKNLYIYSAGEYGTLAYELFSKTSDNFVSGFIDRIVKEHKSGLMVYESVDDIKDKEFSLFIGSESHFEDIIYSIKNTNAYKDGRISLICDSLESLINI